MRVSIKYIGILSAFKFGCLMSIIPVVLVVFILLLSPVVVSNRGTSVNVTGVLTIPIIAYGIFAGFASGVFFAFQAILFNIVAFFFGGLEVKLMRIRRVVDVEEELPDPDQRAIQGYSYAAQEEKMRLHVEPQDAKQRMKRF